MKVNACASELTERGMRWSNNYSWTDAEGSAQFGSEDRPPTALRAAAASDVVGAISADIFVILMVPGVSHRGAWLEFGARLGQNKEAHVVMQGRAEMFFFNHPCVVKHQRWQDFVLAMFPEAGYDSLAVVEAHPPHQI